MQKSDKSPDFEIFAEGRQGNQVKVGAAWKKQSPKCQFLNLKIDDPALSDVLYFKAFKEDNDNWKIGHCRSFKSTSSMMKALS